MPNFSQRHGIEAPDAEITVRHDAPGWLRSLVVDWAYTAGLSASTIRDAVCGLLLEAPDLNNWSPGNIDREIRVLLENTPWNIVYEFIEWVAARRAATAEDNLPRITDQAADEFTETVNSAFRRKGVGWKLDDGILNIRGPEVFEEVVHTSIELSEQSQRTVANNELREALRDLSRRPLPEVTGAIQHGMAALECIARAVTNDPKLTLGEWIKKNRGLLPPPVDAAVEKLWGFASEYGRHVKEGAPAQYEEAELVVGLTGALSVYLMRKAEQAP
jgi:hypothetical protein